MINRMHRCPVNLIDVVQLAGGRRVTLRPALPQDADLHRAFFRGLSAEARYFRFMTRLGELTDDLARSFTNIDHCSHVGLMAEIFDDADEIMIGEARYIVDEQDPAECEFAIAVADAWHATGLARTLLQRIVVHAVASGIRRMAADTVSNNAAMITLAKRAGFSVTRKREDARLVRLARDLMPGGPHSTAESSPYADHASPV